MKPIAPLLVAVCAVAASQTAYAQTPAAWQSAVNVAASPGALQKTGGCDGCPDAGAHSAQQFTSDGYVEFVPGMDQRFYAGLSTDLSASTVSTTMNYAFSFWAGGVWEIRELGVYKGEGTFAAGDHFSVSIENGAVVYRHNGSAVYHSAVAPVYPLVFDTTFYSTGSSLSGAAAGAGSLPGTTTTAASTTATTTTTTTTATTTTSSGTPTRTAVGPYFAVVDRYPYPKPPLPAIGPAGSTIQDPVFGSSITRITDGNVRPGYLNRSFRTPSGTHSLAWSASGTKFYVVSTDGTIIPFTFDPTTRTAKRIQPTTTGEGGLVLRFYLEPQFSFVNDSIVYGSYSGSGTTYRTIDQYDFSTGQYSTLLNLDSVQSGLAGTYVGGIGSSGGPNERLIAFFGGTAQDKHHMVVIFDVANPSTSYQILDTLTSTLNGAPAPAILNFSLHHATIDRSGRFVVLYPTAADMSGPRQAPQMVVWDTVTNAMTPLTASAHPYGHDAFGYGVSVNQDCCTSTSWDSAQWQFRNLLTPTQSHDLIATVLQPKETLLADHPSWNNARSDSQVPYVSGLYRYGANTYAWRAWDDEVVAIETDQAAGTDGTVWRFAHHRSDVRNDLDATTTYFWYEPRPNVSPDGHWVLFTSNWEKTLGTDPGGDPGGSFRQDVFLLELAPASSSTSTPPPPTVTPVAIVGQPNAAAQVNVAYTSLLTATGGSGTSTWAISRGALPAGLTLNGATGVISGTPITIGTFAFDVTVADATNSANFATGSFSIAVSGPPLQITTATAPAGRETVPYSASLTAAGGSGSYAWSIASGTLPPGVTLAAGSLSGVPTTAGSYTFTVVVSDSHQPSTQSTATYVVPIAAAVQIRTASTLPDGTRTVPYAFTFYATNIVGTPVWSLAGGSLPQGLTLYPATGVLSGVPKQKGTYTFQIAVTDASTTAKATVTLKIAQR